MSAVMTGRGGGTGAGDSSGPGMTGGKNGKHRGFHGHGHGRTCPPGKVWDAQKQKCVKQVDEARDIERAFTFKNESDSTKFVKALRNRTSARQIQKQRIQGQVEVLVTFETKADAKTARQLAQQNKGKLFREATELQETSRADMQVNVFIRSIKDKAKKKFAQAFVKSFGRKMDSPSKFGISDDDAAELRSSIDRIQNDFAEAVENLDIPAAVATDIPADAEPTTKTYAGSPVFKVSPETFAKCSGGRKKWARWSKTLNLEDEGQAAIRTYANKYPSRPIVLQCDETGDMKFLRFNRKGGGGNRKRRKTALPTPTDGGIGQIVFDADNEMTEANTRITTSKAAQMLRDQGHTLKANEIIGIARTHGIGRNLRSPALGLVFTDNEVEQLAKILKKR